MCSMAFASQTSSVQEQLIDRPHFYRIPSYSANFQSESAKSWVIADLTDLMDEFKNCTCHLDGLPCRLEPDKHQLFGRIGHLLQEDVRSNRTRREVTRQESIDSLCLSQPNRPRLKDLRSSDSSDSAVSSMSSTDSMRSRSIDEDFVIKKGYLLIINNIWFEGCFHVRSGSKAESDKMKKLFESFGFDVEVEYNQSALDTKKLLKKKTADCFSTVYDCFALLVLSHGAEDCILGTDNKGISYKEVVSLLKADEFPAMAGKPKLAFVQACRGNRHDAGHTIGRGPGSGGRVCKDNDTDLSQTPRVRIPTDSDILIAFATTPGRAALKSVCHCQGSDAVAESWFLDGLHQVLSAYADDEDLLSMLTRVNSHVSMLGDCQIGKQIPAQFSTLTRKIYLRRKIGEVSKLPSSSKLN